MKIATVFIIGFLLSLLVIFLLASDIEDGDTNAISMYFLVFLFPVLILSFLNGLYVHVLSRLKINSILKRILCLVPVVVLIILALKENLSIDGIDGDLTFAAHVAAISLGLTNMLWLIISLKNKVAKV